LRRCLSCGPVAQFGITRSLASRALWDYAPSGIRRLSALRRSGRRR